MRSLKLFMSLLAIPACSSKVSGGPDRPDAAAPSVDASADATLAVCSDLQPRDPAPTADVTYASWTVFG